MRHSGADKGTEMSKLHKNCTPGARKSIKKRVLLDLSPSNPDRNGVRMILEKIIIHMVCSEIKSYLETVLELFTT